MPVSIGPHSCTLETIIMKQDYLLLDSDKYDHVRIKHVTRKEPSRPRSAQMKRITFKREYISQALYYIAVLAVIVGAFLFFNKLNKTSNTIKLQNIELKSTQYRLKELNTQYDKVLQDKTAGEAEKAAQEQRVKELEQQKTELERQLQSKLSEKQRVASIQTAQRVYAAASHSEWLAAAGIAQDQWVAAEVLVSRESSWNPNAYNSIGACSLVQALPCSKIPGDWRDPVNALRWGHQYVLGRYGGWPAALNHSYSHGWY